MATRYQPPTQNGLQLTLDAQLAAGATSSLTLNQSVTGIVQAPGICWVDRIDSSGNKTPTKREYISFTGVSGSQLTGLTRGLAGSSDQVHSVGAIVEFGPDVVQAQADYDTFVNEHTVNGVHASLASLTYIKVVNGQVTGSFNVSGASLQGLPIRPVWVIPGTVSAASTSIGKPVDMPEGGNWEYATVVLRSPISAASLTFDINKNGTSIFNTGTRPAIFSSGTYVSTASIATKSFNRGDVFTVDIDTGGWFVDATVRLHGR